VALSLFTPKYWYKQGQLPQFVVVAAAAGGQPCRFNMGARHVSVQVDYGTDRIWDSADCVTGAGTRTVVVTKDRPAIAWVNWNRRPSVPGCRPESHNVRAAVYTATAISGHFRTQGTIIVLGAPGVTVP
jgi:hypothetical protein